MVATRYISIKKIRQNLQCHCNGWTLLQSHYENHADYELDTIASNLYEP